MGGPTQPLDGLISINGVKGRSASYDGLLQSTNFKINDMDITVSGITVTAINRGGRGQCGGHFGYRSAACSDSEQFSS